MKFILADMGVMQNLRCLGGLIGLASFR